MDAYVYRAALLCEACGEAVRKKLAQDGKAPEEPSDEETYDSDDYPKGPYADGGGESDQPQHCDAGEDCLLAERHAKAEEALPGVRPARDLVVGAFLENDLTDDGVRYVEECVEDDPDNPVVRQWAEFYDIPLPSDDEDEEEDPDDGDE